MKGFTLIEMLVALFIFSLVAAGGVAVLSFTVGAQDAVRGRVARLGELQRTRALLKSDLEQLADRRTSGQGGEAARAALTGGVTGAGPILALTRRGWDNPDRAPRASLQYVEYRVVDGRLERRSRPALDGAPLGAPQRLIDGVESAGVEFLSHGAWSPVWSGAPGTPPPQAVRVTLDLAAMGDVRQLFLLPGGAS